MSTSPRAAMLRQQIRGVLGQGEESRARIEPERVVCGVATADELLGGGLPVGVLTEFVGSECSGRTTLALPYLAALTGAGKVCAWIDVGDALDPESLAASGVQLDRLLWVRCGAGVRPGGVRKELKAFTKAVVGGGGSADSGAGAGVLPQAVGAVLVAHGGLYDRQVRREKKAIGTPGQANRPVSGRSGDREEQVASDRVVRPRGELKAGARWAGVKAEVGGPFVVGGASGRRGGSASDGVFDGAFGGKADGLGRGLDRTLGKGLGQALDQALRATDLLLQNGGFSAIVLDLGGTPAEVSWRIPMATWFRFRAACERTRVSLLLLTQHSCARSSAELVVRMEAGEMMASGKVMSGLTYRAEVERQRSGQAGRLVSIRKPPESERGRWRGRAAWAREA